MGYFWTIVMAALMTCECQSQILLQSELGFPNNVVMAGPPCTPPSAFTLSAYWTGYGNQIQLTSTSAGGLPAPIYYLYRDIVTGFTNNSGNLLESPPAPILYVDNLPSTNVEYFYHAVASNACGVVSAPEIYGVLYGLTTLIPVLTNDTTQGIASASDETYSPAYYGFQFGANTNTEPVIAWYTASGASTIWLQYQFPTNPVSVSRLVIDLHNVFVTSSTANFELQGSNNGSDWTTVTTQTYPASGNLISTYTFSPSALFLYWRVTILSTTLPLGPHFTIEYQLIGHI